MDSIRIIGGKPLHGLVEISGAKNAALPLMAACLLTADKLTLSNMPHLADISMMARVLSHLGVKVSMNGQVDAKGHHGDVLELDASEVTDTKADYEIIRKMRASVLVLGPLLARFGETRVSLPGGCAIGTRPIDLHLKALEQMGAEIELEEGYVHARVQGRLKGARIYFDTVSVGATEHILMAAALAEGTTVLQNAAREPEVSDLAHCLQAMGAEIEGIGSDTLTIHGKPALHGTSHRVVPDRIEAGSYALAAAMTGGDIIMQDAPMGFLEAVQEKMHESGIGVEQTPQGTRIWRNADRIHPFDITTAPHPGFPTDMQAQFIALATIAEGTTSVTETIFENRFMHVPELMRMGADITLRGNTAIVHGVKKLKGAAVMATDLRASMSLILAGLVAEGTTTVNRIYHLDRGYERLEEKLSRMGAQIERISAKS